MSIWISKPPPGIPINWGHPLAQRLATAWLFNEGAGGRIADCVQMRISSQFTNDPVWQGGGIQFASASSQRIDLPDNICVSNGNTAFSVAALMRTTTTTGYRDIWGEGDASAQGLAQLLHNSSNQIEFAIRNDAGTIPGAKITVSGLTDGYWHVVVATYGGSGTTMRVYTDGVERARSTGPTGALTTTLSTIGAIRFNGGTVNYWNGGIGWVYTWRRELSARDVAALSAQPYAFMLTPSWATRFISANSLVPLSAYYRMMGMR